MCLLYRSNMICLSCLPSEMCLCVKRQHSFFREKKKGLKLSSSYFNRMLIKCLSINSVSYQMPIYLNSRNVNHFLSFDPDWFFSTTFFIISNLFFLLSLCIDYNSRISIFFIVCNKVIRSDQQITRRPKKKITIFFSLNFFFRTKNVLSQFKWKLFIITRCFFLNSNIELMFKKINWFNSHI